MYMLQVQMRCYAKFFEVLPDELENAQLMVEDIVSLLCADLVMTPCLPVPGNKKSIFVEGVEKL